jgi:hypothetical protein
MREYKKKLIISFTNIERIEDAILILEEIKSHPEGVFKQ